MGSAQELRFSEQASKAVKTPSGLAARQDVASIAAGAAALLESRNAPASLDSHQLQLRGAPPTLQYSRFTVSCDLTGA